MRNQKNLLPNIILSVLFFILCLYCLLYADSAFKDTEEENKIAQKPIISEQEVSIETSLPPSEVELIETDDEEQLLEFIEYFSSQKEIAHSMAENARALEYEDNHIVIQIAKNEWAAANEALEFYTERYEKIQEKKWKEKEKQYPAATYIWLFLKEKSYSDYVCAGIMGNLMTEVGGHTLSLDIDAVNGVHYGICQWNRRYYKQVWGATLEEQCEYLCNNIEYEIDKYGKNFKQGFDYSDFLALTNEKEVALAFCKAYERCGAQSYQVRQDNATKAYNYFVS